MVGFCVAVGIALGVYGAVVVCSQCGHEAAEGGRFCSHCGAAVGTVASSVSEVPSEAAPSLTPDPLPFATLVEAAWREDIALARSAVTNKPVVAYLAYRNALAYPPLAPGFLTVEQAEGLAREMRACERALFFGEVGCVTCDGTGKKLMRSAGLSGMEARTIETTINCAECGGRGMVPTLRAASAMRLVYGTAVREAEALWRARGRQAEGGAWLPAALKEALSVRQAAAVRGATAPLCGACLGSGMADCTACKNRGKVPCKAAGCVDGWVTPPTTGKVVRPAKTLCTTCDGVGWVACVTCSGKGAKACTACGGVGMRPVCTACRGEGLAACKKCKGDGCRECKGEGVVLCTSCRGDGRKGK
ncbi:MAG: hypothetical protein FWF84_02575 [Kiritimatiellaeota bacterium]|nr:hypothetical protein [Kiritimatiellota bacterium]